MKDSDTIKVTIMTPEAVVFDDVVVSLSSSNSEGGFDIMPDHARFMTLIEKTPIVLYKKDGSSESLSYDSAVIFFEDNVAKIYIHQAV